MSAERGELVTFDVIISISGYTVPSLLVFPRVHFMEGAPEGSTGTANRTGWMNSEIIIDVLKHIKKHAEYYRKSNSIAM